MYMYYITYIVIQTNTFIMWQKVLHHIMVVIKDWNSNHFELILDLI